MAGRQEMLNVDERAELDRLRAIYYNDNDEAKEGRDSNVHQRAMGEGLDLSGSRFEPYNTRFRFTGTNRLATQSDLLDDVEGKHINRDTQQRQRKKRLGAHGINIGDGISRGNAPELVGIIDHRHKKIRGCDDCLLIVQLINRGVFVVVITGKKCRRNLANGR